MDAPEDPKTLCVVFLVLFFYFFRDAGASCCYIMIISSLRRLLSRDNCTSRDCHWVSRVALAVTIVALE